MKSKEAFEQHNFNEEKKLNYKSYNGAVLIFVFFILYPNLGQLQVFKETSTKKYSLVRSQKFVQRLRGILKSKGNQFPVISPLCYCCFSGNLCQNNSPEKIFLFIFILSILSFQKSIELCHFGATGFFLRCST